MATKPADFFLGVVDFFSIVLPRALLAFLFLDFARQNVFGKLMPTIDGTVAGWISFALASYLLGHFASLIGARVLDSIYDWTYVKYKRRKGDPLLEYTRELKGSHFGVGLIVAVSLAICGSPVERYGVRLLVLSCTGNRPGS